jgi:hypothetical protein
VQNTWSERLSENDKRRAREHLDAVLSSPEFRGSRRCQEFLRFIVTQTLQGETRLKERTIAIEVFGRAADYNASEDSSVRVTAHDVRKRLAQFYGASAPDVRLSVPQGSYVPEIEIRPQIASVESRGELEIAPGEKPPAVPVPKRLLWWTVLVGAAAMSLAVAAFVRLDAETTRGSDPHVHRFWAPLMAARGQALVCLGQPQFFVVDGPIREVLRSRLSGGIKEPAYIALSPEDLPQTRIRYVPIEMAGVGDAVSTFQLGGMLARMGKPATLRAVTEVPFADLTRHPTILIGAFSNIWSMEMAAPFRFRFDERDTGYRISDRLEPGRWWGATRTQDAWLVEDHALVSRVIHKETGQPLVILGGITQFGTSAATDFATSDSLLRELDGMAPGWEHKNLQVLLHVRVVQGSVSRPRVIAVHSW